MNEEGVPPDDSTAGVLVRLRGLLPSLSVKERAIGDVVLKDPAGVAQLSISQVAQRAGVSDTSVTRFCRRLGLTGYPELRLGLAAAVQHAHSGWRLRVGMQGNIEHDDTAAEVVVKMAHADAGAIQDSVEQLDTSALDAASRLLAGARRIEVYGVGSSALVAADLEYKLQHLGLLCSAFCDVHRALMNAAHLRPGDVAVGISHSGRTRETLDPLREAALHGATTLALTNDGGSPITELADLVLCSAGREAPFRTGATVSRIGQLFVVDCLYVRLAQAKGCDAANSALSHAYRAVERHRTVPHDEDGTSEGKEPPCP
ncbi:MurR/RpiR family transcriptional regulator [Streptomyces sp. NBC_01320]|uniref:MurR/RpiR family transcriptional regulator n=1 Tax=Streptomyces sp. NBC_01320 TaxID=2903824 RepID=UPI002E139041|nr:MurR/RpiR family transcriptional regulator [Streptomyces sp. NBC_01320]